jgi:hypothetical protein
MSGGKEIGIRRKQIGQGAAEREQSWPSWMRPRTGGSRSPESSGKGPGVQAEDGSRREIGAGRATDDRLEQATSAAGELEDQFCSDTMLE